MDRLPAEEQFFDDLLGFCFLVMCSEETLNDAKCMQFWMDDGPANKIFKREDLQ